MDAKALSDAGRQIGKAVDSGDPPSTLLQLLQPLRTFTATEDLLRHSKIGIAVNRLRQNKDPKVAQLSSQLINKWKADVKTKSKTGSPAPAAKGINGVANGRDATSSPAPKTDGVKKEPSATSNPARKSKVPPEKRTFTADEVNTDLTGDTTRNGCIGLIYNGLAYMSEESPDEVLVAARSVEAAAFSVHNNETSSAYKMKMRSLFQNLKMKGNATLRRDVFNGKIEPKRFVTMTSDELKNAEKRAQDAALEKENMKASMTAQEEKAISTTMTCNKCKQSRVAYTQAQTRSADEPMTTFCECTNCGNRWKFS
ncbi:hypothetical protein BAUCODRAFT_530419 [Baudoinia panamericana UAMH 10762]|uniref:Transcription elongation factor n=1 Tax=Baudoinia panamericana (strain UAMH 10762) TaxID=717646 RepID=M2LLM9_BAUPA|nr:uncharacterized protein BAUCODRAFT_530419 [Baudoinia panamericana UAMH 10762]EMC95202.1 hypothetical protein BAUCODRAFT_530419 [Baudoinia panamericana UAMH 10762]